MASALRELTPATGRQVSESQEALFKAAKLIFKLASDLIDCVGQTNSYDELQIAIGCLEKIIDEAPEHRDCFTWKVCLGTALELRGPMRSSWMTTHGQGSSATTATFEEDTRRSVKFKMDAILQIPKNTRKDLIYPSGSGLLFPALLFSLSRSLASIQNWTNEMTDFGKFINEKDLASVIGIHLHDFVSPPKYAFSCRCRLLEVALDHCSLDYPTQYYAYLAESLHVTTDMTLVRANITSLKEGILGSDLAPKYKGQYDIRPDIALKIAYSLDYQLSDKKLARQYFAEVNNDQNCEPEKRIAAGYRLFRLLTEAGTDHLKDAYHVAAFTLNLISHAVSRIHDTTDRQNFLRDWYQQDIKRLIYDGTYIAIRLKGVGTGKALEFLEKARGIFTNAVEEARIDVAELRVANKDMASEFEDLQTQLHSGPSDYPTRFLVRRRFEELCHQIRELPRFNNFLIGTNEGEMLRAAIAGPIVVINVCDHGCDALVVKPDKIRCLELPDLLASDIQYHRQQLQRRQEGRANHRHVTDHDLEDMLAWLWKVAAGPILSMLGLTESLPEGQRKWPRIWWILTGELSSFPIHAAGNHLNCSGQTVMDRVMSSYSPSIRTLVQSRKRFAGTLPLGVPIHSSATSMSAGQALLIAMPRTPAKDPLDQAENEVSALTNLCEMIGLTPFTFTLPKKADIMSSLEICKIFHFAGHGMTDAADPSQSALLLQDWVGDDAIHSFCYTASAEP